MYVKMGMFHEFNHLELGHYSPASMRDRGSR